MGAEQCRQSFTRYNKPNCEEAVTLTSSFLAPDSPRSAATGTVMSLCCSCRQRQASVDAAERGADNPHNATPTPPALIPSKTACKACAREETVFKRNARCHDCAELYCDRCLFTPPPTAGLTPSPHPAPAPPTLTAPRRICVKCRVLLSGRCTVRDLSAHTARELRAFLARRNIPLDGCTERADLVEIIIGLNRPVSAGMPHPTSAGGVEAGRRAWEEELGGGRGEGERREAQWGNAERESSATSEREPSLDRVGSGDRVRSGEGFGSLRGLTLEQLRDWLTRNEVEFDEVSDRAALISMVREVQAKPVLSAPVTVQPGSKRRTSTVCPSCNATQIDCVLLDCGHMVTCTGCAQKLRHCPACQQYIKRTVRAFRA